MVTLLRKLLPLYGVRKSIAIIWERVTVIDFGSCYRYRPIDGRALLTKTRTLNSTESMLG